jgi:hypothetical protein
VTVEHRAARFDACAELGVPFCALHQLEEDVAPTIVGVLSCWSCSQLPTVRGHLDRTLDRRRVDLAAIGNPHAAAHPR